MSTYHEGVHEDAICEQCGVRERVHPVVEHFEEISARAAGIATVFDEHVLRPLPIRRGEDGRADGEEANVGYDGPRRTPRGVEQHHVDGGPGYGHEHACTPLATAEIRLRQQRRTIAKHDKHASRKELALERQV